MEKHILRGDVSQARGFYNMLAFLQPVEVLYMLFKTQFLSQKQHLPVFALNLRHQPLQRPAHASLTGTRCNNTAPQISVKLEIIPCRADFQRPCLTSLKVRLRGWGIFRQCPAAWRLSAFFPGKSWSRGWEWSSRG